MIRQDDDENCAADVLDGEEGYIYRKPIFVNERSIEEQHYMGTTLSIIVIFNLALLYHLQMIRRSNNNENNTSMITDDDDDDDISYEKALRLYELAYELHIVQLQQQEHKQPKCIDNNNNNQAATYRFTMIISNNLSQIHRVTGDKTQKEQCLQHLLSIIVYAVESKFIDTVVQEKELNGFYDNVSPIMLQRSICARSA